MKHKSLNRAACPVARTLDVVGDWWSLLIIRDAFRGARRFGDFQKMLGLAKNILTVRLRKLVEQGVLELVPASDGSAFREYVLTAKGQDLFVVLTALRQWGEAHCFAAERPRSRLVDARRRKPIRPLVVTSSEGQVLGPSEVLMVTNEPSAQPPGRKRSARAKSV